RTGCSALVGGYPRRRVLVVGTNATAAEVIETVRGQQWLGLDIVGVAVSNSNGTRCRALESVPVLGTREDLPALCARHAIDEVIIASDPSWQDPLLDAFSRHPGVRSRISVVPSPFEILIGRRETLRLHDIPLIEVFDDVPGGAGSVTKRLFDAGFAALLLVPAIPVMLMVALAVRITSRGPVIYRQTRVGRGGQPFTIFKFRTMHEEAERGTGPVLATENDPRVTLLGRVLRATRLDELPQLWNVLRGDMSFVGPRPERPEFVSDYQRDIQGYAERFKVRPGLTGYAQVNGEYHTSASTKLKYDLAYIHNRSLWLDLRILSQTMKVMLRRRGVERVGRNASPPPAVRRLADALLACLALSTPLSISGMQIAMGALGILALLGIPLRWGVVRRTPLDGVLALLFGVFAVSTVASGHPFRAVGWLRPPWLLSSYFVVSWWLRDRDHARRMALFVVAAGAVAGGYGVLQHFTGVDWYREAIGSATRVRPRVPGAEG